MSRSKSDHRVVTVLAALDRAAQSDKTHAGDTTPNGMVALTAAKIVDDWVSCPERFLYDDWQPEAIRALALAYVQHCPESVLDEAATIATEMIEWANWWDREGHADAHMPPSQVDAVQAVHS